MDYPEFFMSSGLIKARATAAVKAGASAEEIRGITQQTFDDGYFHLNGQDGKVRAKEARPIGKLMALVITDPTQESYQSWVPSLYGEQAVKYQLRPCDAAADAKSTEAVDRLGVSEDPNLLRAVLKDRVSKDALCYQLAAQFHQDGDPSVERGELAWGAADAGDRERYDVLLATITVPQTKAGEEFIDQELCEKMSFSPGHAPAAHRGLGSVQRARVQIYSAIETARNMQNIDE